MFADEMVITGSAERFKGLRANVYGKVQGVIGGFSHWCNANH